MPGRDNTQRDLVIVVDDDPAVRDSVVMLLESCGWRVVAFASAQAMLAGVIPRSARRCLLVDLQLPGMTGLELLEHLRARGCALPAIVMTGRIDRGARLREDVTRVGALALLDKPLDADELEATVARALAASV